MRRLNFNNCVISCGSAGCLFILFAFLIILFFANNIKDRIVTRNSHLQPQSKAILTKIMLISDSESDWEYLEKSLNEAKTYNINNVIHLGDITQLGTPDDLSKAKAIFEESELNVYSVPGDRDLWKSKGIEGYLGGLGSNYGMINIDGLNFLLIDNSDEYEGINDVQWLYIVQNISNADFVILHNPIYFDLSLFGGKGMGEYSVEVKGQRERLLSLVRESNVKAVFGGDRHLFGEFADEGHKGLFHYVIGSTNSSRNLQSPNFSILTIYTDGDYYVENVVI